MGKGLLMGALGGAARGVTGYAEDEQKKLALEESQQKQIAHERMMMNERADLEVNKTALIEEMRAKRARDAGLKQGSDIQAEVSRLDSEDTGVDAHKKSLGLLNATRQEVLEREIKAAGNLGYLDVAKEKRSELQTELQNQKYDDATKNQNRRMDIQEKFNEDRARIQDKLALIQESRANRIESRVGSQMEKAELQSTRQALTSVLGDIGKQEDRLQSIIKDTFDPSDKERLQKQMNDLDQSRKDARAELMKLAGVDQSKQSAKESPYAEGTRLQKDGKTYVVQNGKPVLETQQTKSQSDQPTDRSSTQSKQPPSEDGKPKTFGVRSRDDILAEAQARIASGTMPKTKTLADIPEYFRKRDEEYNKLIEARRKNPIKYN